MELTLIAFQILNSEKKSDLCISYKLYYCINMGREFAS